MTLPGAQNRKVLLPYPEQSVTYVPVHSSHSEASFLIDAWLNSYFSIGGIYNS